MESAAPRETIAAIATAPGRGGIGVLRLSGVRAALIANAIAGPLPPPRQAALRCFRDESGEAIDTGLLLYFAAPASFTGEDVCELQGHGGPVVLDMLLRRSMELGARLARPGEFSERAFLAGKLDLAQAEAIADLIDSANEAAARSALRSLQGEFSSRIDLLLEQLTSLRVFVEASIDFPEEEIDFLQGSDVEDRLLGLLRQLRNINQTARTGALMREGITVALAGRPNAGKSSLLNVLSGREAAIVSAIPGTTRDTLRQEISLDGMPLHLVDTAGLRESEDEIEVEGMRRARKEIASADLVLLVIDSTLGEDPVAVLREELGPDAPSDPRNIIVLNKCDVSGIPVGHQPDFCPPALGISALTGAGIEALCAQLRASVGYAGPDAGAFSARRRHLDALSRCEAAIVEGLQRLRESRAAELLAEDLRTAQQALGEITGVVTTDDLLGRIFASFCIGK